MRWLCMTSLALALLACSGDSDDPGSGASGQGSSGSGASGAATGGSGGSAGSTAGGAGSSGSSMQAGAAGSAAGASGSSGGSPQAGAGGSSGSSGQAGSSGGPSAPTAAQLLALLKDCNEVSKGRYQTDDEDGAPASVAICGLPGAFYWQADMDVDCDGKTTAVCSPSTDPAYQDQTSVTDSKGDPLDASTLPYVVVPLPSSRFAYDQAGLALGDVVAVIYQDKVAYGVFGDEGPENIIGEASYAMAKSLGIDPDPSTGGTDGPVWYIAFKGPGAVVAPIEDHAAAVTLGQQLAQALLAASAP